jgi:hypothetical protein
MDAKIYLFNRKVERDDCNYFLFEQGIVYDFSCVEKEYLKLYESWCLFAYREFYKESSCNFGQTQQKDIWRKDKHPEQIFLFFI